MRIMKILQISALAFVSVSALADDKDCSALTNPQARQQCLQVKYGGKDVDCSKLGANQQARKECLDYKANSADCSKLATPQLRQQCAKQKVN